MTLALLFWPLMTLPGYAIARRWFARDLESGLPGVIAVSFLLSMAALSPVSIACYVLGLPVAVFSAACVIAVLVAAVDLTRSGAWGGLARVLTASLCVELLILAVDVAMGARTGGYLAGDAIVHVGRIRFLLDHGFSNLNPNFLEAYFFPIYHTNLLHGLVAAGSQLTPTDHLGMWVGSLAWAKVLTASGVYTLAWTIFGRRWPAWAAVLFVIAVTGPVPFMQYPNKLAPWYLVAMMFAFAIRIACGEDQRRSVVLLAVGAVVVGQVHGLYGLFAVLTIGPMLAGAAVVAQLRKVAWKPVAAGALVVCCALPLPIASKIGRPSSRLNAGPSPAAVAAPAAPAPAAPTGDATAVVRFENGWSMRNPRRGFSARGGWRPVMLIVAATTVLLTDRRRYAIAMTALLGLIGVYLYVPPLFTLAVTVFEREWIVIRMEEILKIGFAVLVPPAIVALIARRSEAGWTRILVGAAIFTASMRYTRPPTEYLTWKSYGARALGRSEDRTYFLDQLRSLRDFVSAHVPVGGVILADEYVTQRIVSVHDSYGVSAAMGSSGVPDLGRRRADLAAMLSEATPWEQRRGLLEFYGIRFFVPNRGRVSWLDGKVQGAWQEEGVAIIVELALDGGGFRLDAQPDGGGDDAAETAEP